MKHKNEVSYCDASFSRLQMNNAMRSGVIAIETAKRNPWLEEFEALNPVVLSLHMAGIVKNIDYCSRRRHIGADGWLKVERRLADCVGETLTRFIADEARGSPGAPETRLQARRRNQGALMLKQSLHSLNASQTM